MSESWLEWAKRLQAISQTGLAYANNPFDVERFEAVREIASEIMASASNISVKEFVELFKREEGYATPKVDTRGAVFQDNKILLVKERVDNGWTLPGGWADVGDTPGECVVREIFEESGFRARAVKLVAVYDRNKHPHTPPLPFHIYKLFFLCELTGGAATRSIETADVDFFPEDQIPPLSLSRVTSGQIQRMFAHFRNPALPTEFD